MDFLPLYGSSLSGKFPEKVIYSVNQNKNRVICKDTETFYLCSTLYASVPIIETSEVYYHFDIKYPIFSRETFRVELPLQSFDLYISSCPCDANVTILEHNMLLVQGLQN